ncbi:MAG: hypothetical protein Q7T74_06970 [Candidatus Saccharibacteria bacterium]|nr:hypothetical protein [Candidatus Saccharibacteria bacterium]
MLKDRCRQRGNLIIESIIVLAILMVITLVAVAIARFVNQSNLVYRERVILTAAVEGVNRYFVKNGESIVSFGSAPGFADPLSPTVTELISKGFFPPTFSGNTPSGGNLLIVVRRGVSNDLTGIVCDNKTIQENGKDSFSLAAKIALATPSGVSTSPLDTATLNGSTFKGIGSPFSSPALACAIAYLPAPT